MLCMLISTNAQFSGNGNGTEESPYQITNAAQFDEIRNFLGEENDGVNFTIANDIDFTEWFAENNSENGWQPIGEESNAFYGNLNGGEYTLSGLWSESESYAGVFGYIKRGKIDDLTIKTGTEKGFTGNDYVGILAAYISESEITNVHIEGKLTGNNYVGGLAGSVLAGSTITDNSAAVTILAQGGNVGGLIGESNSPLSANSTSGSIESYGDNIGGLVGTASEAVANSTSSVDVTNLGDIFVGNFVGGLVGTAQSSVSNSSASGKVTATNVVGGLVGNSFAPITDSHATGEVIANAFIGGLVGASDVVTNSYATGNVKGNLDMIGGLAGGSYGAVTMSYATGAVSGAKSVGGLIGTSYGLVSHSFASGDVACVIVNIEPEGGYIDIGGLIGHSFNTVSDTYATGNVSSPENSMYIGGLIGFSGEVHNSYASGRIETAAFSKVGGLIGETWGAVSNSVAANPSITSAGTIDINRVFGNVFVEMGGDAGNCYALETMYVNGETGLEGSANDMNGEGMSVEELQTELHYTSSTEWDFEQIWTIREGKGYPYFGYKEYLTNIITAKVNDAVQGTINPVGEMAVEVGESQTFSITPAQGFEIESVLVDNENLGTVNSYTFTNVTENHVIEVIFKQEGMGSNDPNIFKTQYYPNPVSDILHLNSKETISKIEVLDLSGKVVLTKNAESKNIQLDLNSIKTGIYLVKLTSKNKTETIKIIKR